MNLDQTDHKGAILSRSLYLRTYSDKMDEAKVFDWWKRSIFVYLACPTNPLKGPELSTLNFGRTLVSRCLGQVWLNSFS